MNDSLVAEEDNLLTPPVGSWAESKYKIIYDYNCLFSTGMKKFWNQRVYIDLYSGSGKAKVRNSEKILYSSSLLAIKVPDKFDKYIYCDIDTVSMIALQKRIKNEFSELTPSFISGDCNEKIDEIINVIPQYSKQNTVLSFCFIDPFSLKINFDTIKKLGEKRIVDFLILLAFGMDGKRNIGLYIDENHDRIDNFLGLTDWRERWKDAEKKGTNLVKFLADEFTQQMVKLGYLDNAINNFIPIRSNEKNLPLYYLAFFSKHKTGYDFWKKVKMRNTEPELEF